MVEPDLFDGGVRVKVSSASCRLLFTECGPACIEQNGCGGNCCDAPSRPGGCLVTVHQNEIQRIEALGASVVAGFIQPRPGTRGCPFKAGGLCDLHATGEKPFGCIASPFTLNACSTLIVRNRYKMLPCYRGPGRKAPAYKVFCSSLTLLFGRGGAAQITAHLDAGGGDLMAFMPAHHAAILQENDAVKRGLAHG